MGKSRQGWADSVAGPGVNVFISLRMECFGILTLRPLVHLNPKEQDLGILVSFVGVGVSGGRLWGRCLSQGSLQGVISGNSIVTLQAVTRSWEVSGKGLCRLLGHTKWMLRQLYYGVVCFSFIFLSSESVTVQKFPMFR